VLSPDGRVVPDLAHKRPGRGAWLTAERALEIFAHLGATGCRRHELPKLRALNFVIENALGGGVNAALGLDRHGKTLSFLLLGELTVDVPRDAVPDGSPYLTTDGPATGRGTAIRSTTDQGTAVRPATD